MHDLACAQASEINLKVEATRDAELTVDVLFLHVRTGYCSPKHQVWQSFIIVSECKFFNLGNNKLNSHIVEIKTIKKSQEIAVLGKNY